MPNLVTLRLNCRLTPSSPQASMHLANLFRHNRVNILLRGQTEVELTSGHEVEGEPVAEGGEEPRAQVV